MWKIGSPVIATRKPEHDAGYVRHGVTIRAQEDGRRGVVVDMSSASNTYCMLRDGVRSWWEADELSFDGVGFLERLAALVPDGAQMTGTIEWRIGGVLNGIEIFIGATGDEKKAGV